jgi:hypothetical protein
LDTSATIDVPDDCTVSTTDVLQLGNSVRSITFDKADGVMSPTKLLVDGDKHRGKKTS